MLLLLLLGERFCLFAGVPFCLRSYHDREPDRFLFCLLDWRCSCIVPRVVVPITVPEGQVCDFIYFLIFSCDFDLELDSI